MISGIAAAIADTQLAFEVGGIVESVEVDLGSAVEKGQVLARLDPEPFELGARDAEAALAEAGALQELARSTLTRFLEAGAAVARQEVDQARAMRDARDQQVEASEARLNLARRDLRRSVLKTEPGRGSSMFKPPPVGGASHLVHRAGPRTPSTQSRTRVSR